MNLTTTSTCFREVLKEYDNYERCVTLRPGDIPEGCSVDIEGYDDYQNVCIYRDHPFNEQVKATRAAKVAAYSSRADSYPTVKFVIDGWTPDKLAEMQAKAAQRVVDYKAATARIDTATKAYNEAFEAQLLEIKGENHV